MADVNVYIRDQCLYDENRRINGIMFEGDVLEPEYFNIVIFGRSVYTVYTDSPGCANSWIKTQIRLYNTPPAPLTMGLDIQLNDDADLDFHPYPSLSTLQLCIGNQCLIYHMYQSDLLPILLERFLTRPGNTFIGFYMEYKLAVLRHHSNYTGYIDYRELLFVAYPHCVVPESADLREVVARLLRQELVYTEPDPNWLHHSLDVEQIMYACAAAHLSLRCGLDPFPVT